MNGSTKQKRIFIVTGEHSGDIHAAKVAQQLGSEYEIEGIGGENLKNAGVKLFSGHEKMGQVGISLKMIIDHITLGRRVVDYITKVYKPDLVLLVDYGAFNLGISRFLKKAGIKTFYYIPPQVWASRKHRIKTIKKYIDKVLCIFPFEKPLYESYGINTHYCGHPLIAQLPPKADRTAFFKKHGLDPAKKLVSIFPGSRVFELKNLMEIFVKSAKELHKEHPELQFCISHAPNLPDKVFEKFIPPTPLAREVSFKVIKGENQALLSISDALILASGTVSLEAALYQVPMIIAYRGPFLFYLIYLVLRSIKRASLPNIIADKDIVPELLQYDATAGNIVYEIEKLLYDTLYREENIRQLSQVRAMLSDKNSAYEAADAINKDL
ncbi:MAG: lipid-A-disaccharide synthase [Heliobacteriaceae bacterium]|nr:lipid-A-disaccharide synthase [Heliobacteriaceae bacterium]